MGKVGARVRSMLSNIAEVTHTSANAATSVTSAQAVAANPERNGLAISLDSATATDRLFIKLGATATAATATNFDFVLAPDQSWPGLVGAVIWQGAVQMVANAATAGARTSVTEV